MKADTIPAVKAVPLAKLTPAPWNPRTIREERFKNLCKSIEADPEFLWRRPVLATANGTIYAGNMRYRAAAHLGMATVPAIVEDVPEQLAKERALRDNAQWGDWHEDQLAEMIYGLKADGADLELLGIEPKELARLLGLVGVGGTEGLTDPDNVPETVEPRSKRGDLWLLGEHRVLCGDATTDVSVLMDGARAVCMWTDPPYGVSIVGGNRRLSNAERIAERPDSSLIANDTPGDLPDLLFGAFGAAPLEPGSPWYCARPPGAHSFLFADAIRKLGWKLHEELQWVKGTMVLGHSDYHLRHETIMYGWTPGEGRSGRGNHDGSRWYGDNAQTSVFEIPLKPSPDHPSMKPAELVAAHIGNSAPPGGLVYDPFLGSGTTVIACEQLGRKCYGMEIEPHYVDVIVARWESFTGRTAVLAE